MKRMRLLFLFFIFIFEITQFHIVSAQTDKDSAIAEKYTNGYIFMRGAKDTLWGEVELITTSKGYIKNVFFETKINKRRIKYRFGTEEFPQDTLRFFGFNNKHYKYINYDDKSLIGYNKTSDEPEPLNSIKGWVEILERSPVLMCRGFSMSNEERVGVGPMMNGVPMSTTYTKYICTPMYSLKKGNEPTVLIGGHVLNAFHYNYMENELDNTNKSHFMKYISDYPELSDRVKKQEKILFKDVEKIINEYNVWLRNKSK